MLNNEHNAAWMAFEKATDESRLLDPRERLLVRFAAALAMDCDDCMFELIDNSLRLGMRREELDEVATQVARVAATHQRGNVERAFRDYDQRRDPY